MEWRTVGRGETEREDLMTNLRVHSSSQRGGQELRNTYHDPIHLTNNTINIILH